MRYSGGFLSNVLLCKDCFHNLTKLRPFLFLKGFCYISNLRQFFFLIPVYSLVYLFTGAMHINKHKCKCARISLKGYFSSLDP